jgi:hypothetical protein
MTARPPMQRMHSSLLKSRSKYTNPLQTRISPADELQCQQIYEKLEHLQPNGVCANLETLRRALYPPLPIPKNRTDQILLLRTSSKQ